MPAVIDKVTTVKGVSKRGASLNGGTLLWISGAGQKFYLIPTRLLIFPISIPIARFIYYFKIYRKTNFKNILRFCSCRFGICSDNGSKQ